jgi:hypothetical protein
MIYSETTLTEKTTILKTAIDKAEALIIGAGTGLSAAALPNTMHTSSAIPPPAPVCCPGCPAGASLQLSSSFVFSVSHPVCAPSPPIPKVRLVFVYATA